MDEYLKDHYREAARSYTDSTAGDDLNRVAEELEHLKGFLLGLCRYRTVDAELLNDLACAEEAVQEILAPRWNACQASLAEATEAELDEMDTSLMGDTMPSHFFGMTVEALKAAVSTTYALRVATNPATRGDL